MAATRNKSPRARKPAAASGHSSRLLHGGMRYLAQGRLGLVRQRILDGLGKGRVVIGCVVVDEQDLVVRIGHHLRQRIEADRRALVQIVAVLIVAAVAGIVALASFGFARGLAWSREIRTWGEALREERRIKGLRKPQKEALLRGDAP